MYEAIYFTKENNDKKIVGTAESNKIGCLIQITEKEKKIFQRTLGHPLKNLFINIDGKEYKLINAKASTN